MSEFTTDQLLLAVARRGWLPTATNTFSDSEILAVATEELRTYIMPLVMSVREEFAVETSDVTVASGTASTDVPYRAVGEKLRSVQMLVGNDYLPLNRLEPEREGDYGTSSTPYGYILRGNLIVLVPTPASAVSLRVRYYARPSKLVATTEVMTLTAINTSTKVVTASSAPATFTASVAYDFVHAKPGFAPLGIDLSASAVGATTATMSATLPTGLAVGDYLCLAGESPVPQCPVECHPLLAQRTAFKIWEALGQSKKAEQLEAVSDKMASRVRTMLSPRDDGAHRVIVNRNGPGWRGVRGTLWRRF